MSELMQRILDILAEGRRSIGAPEASQWKALALARWEMMRALSRFVAEKANVLTKIKDERLSEGEALTVRKLIAENERVRDAYTLFAKRWELNSPLNVNDNYKTEALAMASRIEKQIVSDAQDLELIFRRQS